MAHYDVSMGPLPDARGRSRLARIIVGWLERRAAARHQRAASRSVAALPDRMLKDIGVARGASGVHDERPIPYWSR